MQEPDFRHFYRAESPVLVVTPHTGTVVPPELLQYPAWDPVSGRVSDPAGTILLSAAEHDAVSRIGATVHPCVIDMNGALDSRPYLKRLNGSVLCRTHNSRGEPLYPSGQEPGDGEVEARVEAYWRPFHAAVSADLLKLRARHRNVVMLVSQVGSWLSPFRAVLDAADFNAGTDQGASCDRRLVASLTETVQTQGRSWVVNGQVATSFAAQRYGMPIRGIHVIEIEIAGRWRSDCELQRSSDNADRNLEEMRAIIRSLEQSVRQLPPATSLAPTEFDTDGREESLFQGQG